MSIQNGFAPSYWQKRKLTLTGSSSVDAISIVGSKARGIKYIVSLWNDSENKTKIFELLVNNANGSLKDSLFGRVGDIINTSVDVSYSSGNVVLAITNNESFPLSIDIGYLILG